MKEEEITSIVLSILKKCGYNIPDTNMKSKEKKLLVLGSHDVDLLNEFKTNGWNIHHYNKDSHSLQEFQAVFADKVDRNIIVQVALGLSNHIHSEWIINALMQNKQVYIRLGEEFNVLLQKSDHPYTENIRKYYQQLEQYGVEFINSVYGKGKTVQKIGFKGRLLKELDVKNYSGNELIIDSKTLVTPLALDCAKKKGIIITEERRGEEV